MSKSRYVMIGGFLGAGKTTAMLKLAQYLASKDLRAGLITNDQSVGLVDTARTRAAGFLTREITGGCFCCKFDGLAAVSQQITIEANPDVVIAEPVGSCTDVKATVSYPLRKLYGQQYDVAPLSVLVDPIRCAQALGLEEGGFSEKVEYVYLKQLEEAELLVINKVDLMEAAARQRLVEALRQRFPQARVYEVSCKTEEGLAAWFDTILAGSLGSRPAMQVDYDIYAEGEALLGWLNATAHVSAAEPFDGNYLLAAMTRNLRQQLADQRVEIAHLKLTLSPEQGCGLGAISLTRTSGEAQPTHTLPNALSRGQLTVNLRAEADPELLKRQVTALLSTLSPLQTDIREISAFRPGRPTPTHRMASATA